MADNSFVVYHYLVVYAKRYDSMTPPLLTLKQHVVVLSHVGYIVPALQQLAHYNFHIQVTNLIFRD